MSTRPGNLSLFLNNKLAAVGLGALATVLVLALLTPVFPLMDPDATALVNRLKLPLEDGHILGTDHLGRDLLSRLLWGTRVSILVGLSATLIAALFGSAIGLVAGYVGGRTDHLLMRGIDMLMAFPYILLALAIVAVLGPGLLNALYAIALVNIPFFARNIRGITLSLSRRDFVDAARLSGKSHTQILLTEVLPNVLPIIVITMSTTVGWMILETAGLSFLGLGAQPPQADLGSMLGEGRKLLFTSPHVSIIPGIMIFILVMSINLVGDGVRDVLDPRLKSGVLSRPAAKTKVAPRTTESTPLELPSNIVLDVRDLSTEFRLGNEVYKSVGGVSFQLIKKECLGLVGESGSGKSVTALSLLGLAPTPPGIITAGQVLYDGSDLLDADLEELRHLRGNRISYIFQDPLSTLHPLFTVGDQIAETIRSHYAIPFQQAWSRSVELLDMVRIPNAEGRANAYPHELSGGMRQRVGIAMALANDASIIIADEPTTALDVTVQAEVLKLLDQLRVEKQASLLFITHDFGVVSELCDRVAVMYAGRIIEMGTTSQILDNPQHPYTRKLIACVPVLGQPNRRLDTIEGLPPPVNRLPDGCAFAPRCDQAIEACLSGGLVLDDIGDGHVVECIRAREVTA